MSLIDEVRRDREDLARVLKKHLGIRKIVEELYPDNAHFLYELLQNAEDTGATEVSFTLSADRLAYEHNGRPFEIKDIEGITDIGEGTKADDDEKIGRFGVGFKAVFAYSETPHIWSPTFSFKILELVLPAEIPENNSFGMKTRFEFPFNNPKKSANAAYAEIKSGLDSLHEMTLLFLNNIGTISWKIGEGKEKKVSRLEHTECQVELIRTDKGGGDSKSAHYLRFKRPVAGLAKQNVAIAFPLEFLPTLTEKLFKKKDSLEDQFRITPAIPGRVSVYFPAEKEASGLRFHLHAPFVPELSRASIKDTPTNLPLYKQLAELTVDSLHQIRDLGLLTGGFLSVLPNNNDSIPPRYQHIRASIITAMNEKRLTPKHSGTHAPATLLWQSKAVLKELLSSDDLNLLKGGGHQDWAIGASQKNSDQDRFLSALSIKEFSIDDFADLLASEMHEWVGEKNVQLKNWFEIKAASWHQKLYSLLHQEIEDLPKSFRDVFFVRCRGGLYCRPSECYFPVAGKDYGDELPLVDEMVFASGNSKSRQDYSRAFLESIGVCEVSETAFVEKILKHRYSRGHLRPNDRDLERFIELVENSPSAAILFKEYFIFKRPDGKWTIPSGIFIDRPFRTTGLSSWHAALGDNATRSALHEDYETCGIMPERLAKFAEAVGAQVRLDIVRTSCRHNPDSWNLYHNAPGGRKTGYEQDDDYTIVGIEHALKRSSVELSKLIWHALIDSPNAWTAARYCKNYTSSYRHADSQLVHHLKTHKWVPQEDGVFVKPCDASVDKLPQGFLVDRNWVWLRKIGFGESEEAIERAKQRQADDEKRKLEHARGLGLNDISELQDALRFAKLPPDERHKFFAEQEKGKLVDLPDHSPKNATLRADRVGEQAKEAPERINEQRWRSVATGKSAVTKQADEYLHHQYTNLDGVMICQVCRNELPFKLSDRSYYFETVEFLSLTNRHLQNHLALCPNHAAMFKHANGSKAVLLQLVKDLDGNDIAIELAGADAQIYFTTTHIVDLKAVINADTSMTFSNGGDQDGASHEDFGGELESTILFTPEANAQKPRSEEHARELLSPEIHRNRPEMVQCPKCAAQVRKDRLRKHLARAHNKQQNVQSLLFSGNQPPINKPAVKPSTPFRYENCPHCHQLLLTTQLNEHIARFHSGNQPRVTPIKRG